MADEQELLTLEEAKPFCKTAKIHYATGWTDTFTWDALGLLKAQVAKLKTMGYVKWDREKVAGAFMTPLPKLSLGNKYRFALTLADQLKEILGGK